MKAILSLFMLLTANSIFSQSAPPLKIINRELVIPSERVNSIADKIELALIKKTLNRDHTKDIFITNNLNDWRKLGRKKEGVLKKIMALEVELEKDGNGEKPLSDLENKAKKAEKQVLKDEVLQIDREMNELFDKYVKEYLQFRRVNVFGFGPRRSFAFFDILYGNEGERLRVLNSAGFNIGNNTGSVYSELISDILGVFRLSLGTMVASTNIDDKDKEKLEEAYQRLSTYGGNTVLNIEYPLAWIHSINNQYNLLSRLIIKGTADFPQFGTSTENWAGSASAGINVVADASSQKGDFRFFAIFNYNLITGTDAYRDNLKLSNNRFSFGQFTVGAVIAKNIRLSFILSTLSSQKSLQNRNVIAGGQLLK